MCTTVRGADGRDDTVGLASHEATYANSYTTARTAGIDIDHCYMLRMVITYRCDM